MKKLFRLALIAVTSVIIFSSMNVFANEIQIRTSAFSEMCKNKIESVLKNQKGVSDAFLSMSDKIVTITYNSDMVKPEDLQKSIKELGYDADLIKSIETKSQSIEDKTVKIQK
jgi:copper chaperone CopZ